MDKEFLTGYLALADGEKDPRNLLVAFAIARVILIEFNTADYVEVCPVTLFRRHTLSYLHIPGAVQRHLLLLSDHLPPSPKRSLRNYYRGPETYAEVTMIALVMA